MWERKTCLGVDISDKDIKIVELRKSGSKYQVVQASRLEIGSSGITNALKHFLAETNTDNPKVVWSLPTHECSVKFAQLPKTGHSEIARMARYEAESQIPLPLADLIWGYSNGKPSKEDGLSHVIIAGARQTIVQETAASIEAADLHINAAMVASLAETEAILNDIGTADGPIVIVNIGEEWTNLTTVADGKVTSCRSVRMGIAGLQYSVAADLCVEINEACELIYKDCSIDDSVFSKDPSNIKSVVTWVEHIASEIRRSALAPVKGTHGTDLRAAVITGDGAAVAGLTRMLAASTGITIKTGDPWNGMSLSLVAAHNKRDIPAVFSVATGLALTGLENGSFINLMPSERAEVDRQKRKDVALLATLSILPLVLLAIFLLGQYAIGEKMTQLETMKLKTKSIHVKQEKTIDPEIRQTTTLMETITTDLQNKNNSPFETLKLLSQNFPKSCWLTEFRFESGKSIVLRGNALSNSAVADAVYMLSNTAGFESVSLDYSNLGKSTTLAVYDFQIKCTLSPNASILGSTKKNKATRKERIVVR